MRSDDLDVEGIAVFEGLEPAEPSARADEAILRFARARLRFARRRRRLALCSRVALVASLLAAVALGLRSRIGPAPRAGDGLGTAASGDAISVFDPLEEIAELKAEVSAIGEMAELIPHDRRDEREQIASRVKECLASIEQLERRIGSVDTSFFWETESRTKEANA
ncbi:MAG: hypothetical protein ACUVYA_17670 [Planctomycetota bacterium]